MTTFFSDSPVATDNGVYAPQEDSRLLIGAMRASAAIRGRSVLDLCTGSGVVAIAAAQLGAGRVLALDISRRAVRCARRNAATAGMPVEVRIGTCSAAAEHGTFDVVVSNPPYVPAGPDAHREAIPAHFGPPRAWDAGPDGRMVLDPLCAAAPQLLSDPGSLFIVQSEFADPERSLRMLRRRGMDADIVAAQIIPFGPVLTARAAWMESTGLLPAGRREEEIVVIRAEKR